MQVKASVEQVQAYVKLVYVYVLSLLLLAVSYCPNNRCNVLYHNSELPNSCLEKHCLLLFQKILDVATNFLRKNVKTDFVYVTANNRFCDAKLFHVALTTNLTFGPLILSVSKGIPSKSHDLDYYRSLTVQNSSEFIAVPTRYFLTSSC